MNTAKFWRLCRSDVRKVSDFPAGRPIDFGAAPLMSSALRALTSRGIAPTKRSITRKGIAFSHITAAQPPESFRVHTSLSSARLLFVGLWQSCLLLCLLNQAGVLAQPAPPTPPPTPRVGQISGRVLDDSGQPLAAAIVRLSYVGVTSRGSQPNSTTDGEGRFQFNNLSPGNYRFTISERGLVMPEFAGFAPTYRLGDQVTLNLVKGAVITGRVTSALGEPLVGLDVNATRLRDASGKPVTFTASRLTDDRGVYRLYGLPPGVYVVNTAKTSVNYYEATAFDGEAPTFYPSGTRDTATEITLSQGEEVSGIDIRHRGELGRVISGRLTGAVASAGSGNGKSVNLRLPASQQVVATTYVFADAQRNAFIFAGVADGEYELIARRGDGADGGAASAPRKITVKGADITDIELSLSPLASISGKLALEPAKENEPAKCAVPRTWSAPEVFINTPRLDKTETMPATAAANEQHEFRVTGLDAGRYALTANLPSESWYVKSIAQETLAAGSKRVMTPLRNALALSSGQAATGFVITLAEGAAQLSGSIPPRKQPHTIHLIPAEATAADDVWRYGELPLRDETAFQFKQLAPGKYWLLVLPSETNSPAAYDAVTRLQLRNRAATEGKELMLAPCQRVQLP